MGYYGNNDYRDYLAHHGILGQKWGKRNGPPYPLGASAHSASEKEAGWKNSLTNDSGSVRYGGLNKESSRKIEKHGKKIKTSPGPKLKAKQYTVNEDIKAVNPNRYTQNCMYCTTAFELRRRGYDVEANYRPRGLKSKAVEKWFPGSKVVTHRMPKPGIGLKKKMDAISTKTGDVEFEKKISKEFKDQGVGARGNLMIVITPTTGHSIAYEVTEKGVKLYDAQTTEIVDEETTKGIFRHVLGLDYVRLDNVDFDEKAIMSVVKNRHS